MNNKERLLTILGFFPLLYLVLLIPIFGLAFYSSEPTGDVIVKLFFSPAVILILEIISAIVLIAFRYDRTKLYTFICTGCRIFIAISVLMFLLVFPIFLMQKYFP